MDKLGIRATLYDLVGYILPGFLLLSGLYIIFVLNGKVVIADLFQFSISVPFSIMLLVASYITGHIIASIGSLLFETKVAKKFYERAYAFDTSIYNSRTNMLFGYDFKDCGERTIIAFCQEKHPILYDVAFVFLSIYGFSRNIAIALIVLTVIAIIQIGFDCIVFCISILCISILLHNFFRFKQYFMKQIASSIMLTDHNTLSKTVKKEVK